MSFIDNFKAYMDAKMLEMLAQAQAQQLSPPGTAVVPGVGTAWRGPVSPQQGVATQYAQQPVRPPLILPDQAMLENVASAPMFGAPSPPLPAPADRRHFAVPGAAGPATPALSAQEAQEQQVVRQRAALPWVAAQLAQQGVNAPVGARGLAPFQIEQETEQRANAARQAAQQEIAAPAQQQAQTAQTAAIDGRALAKLVNGIVAQGYSRESAEAAATEVLTGFEAGGVHVSEADVDQYLIDTTAMKAGSVQFEAEDTHSPLESIFGAVSGAAGDVAGTVADKGLGLLEEPLNYTEGKAGGRIYALATGAETWEPGGYQEQTTGEPVGWDAFALDPNNKQAIIDAYENGYVARDKYGQPIAEFGPGEEAVWELFVSQEGNLNKAVYQTVMDPLNMTPLAGAAAKGTRAAAKGRRVGFLELEDAGRVAEEAGDTAGAAVAREAARKAEREAAALNAVATVLRGIDLPNEVIDRAVGGVFDFIRRAGGAIPISDRQLVADATEEVAGGRQTLGRARAEEIAAAPPMEATDVTAEIVPPPTRGFGPGGIGPAAPQQEAASATATIIPPQPSVAARPQQPRYGREDFPPPGPSNVPFMPPDTPRQARLGPSTPMEGAEPLPPRLTPEPPRQATLGDAPPPQQAAPQPSPASIAEAPPVVVDDAAGIVTFEGVEDIRVKRTGQGSRQRWTVQERKPGGWRNQGEKFKEQSEAVAQGRQSVLARQGEAIDETPIPGVDETSVLAKGRTPNGFKITDRSKGGKTDIVFDAGGGASASIRSVGRGGDPPYTVIVETKSSPGAIVRTVDDFDESFFIADNELGRLTGKVRIPDEPLGEGDVLAQSDATPASTQTPPRSMRPHDILPPDYQYPPKVNGRSSGGKRDVNREQRRAAMLSMPDRFVMPKEDLEYLDPAYAKDDPDAVPTFAEQVAAEYGPRNPQAAEAFWAEYGPEATRFIEEDRRLARKSGGKTPEARETPERELHRVEFEARREVAFRTHFGGDDAPVRENRYDTDLPNIPTGDKRKMAASGDAPEDLRAIVEQAVFGEDDVATRARAYLHAAQNNPAINAALGENPSTVAKRLSALRKGLMGEESLSQTKYAKAQRKKAARADVSADAAGITATATAEPRARSLYRRTLRALQPEVEEAIDPGFVDEVTEADGLYNGGRFGDEDRVWLNQEINAPQVKKNDEGTWYDAGWVSNRRATTFKAGESKRAGVIQPAEGSLSLQTPRGMAPGRTTVLDAIDDLVAQGVDDGTINTVVGRLIAEARGVNVAEAVKEASRFGRAYNGWNRFVRENTQFWIGRVLAGWFQDAVSDGWTATVHGMPGIAGRQLDPHLNKLVMQSVAGSKTADELLSQHEVFRYINDLGDDVPVELSALGQGRVDAPLSGETIAGKYLNFNVKGRRVGPGGLIASKWARDLRTTGDRVRRFLAFDHSLRAEMRDAAGRFDVLLGRQAERRGVPVADWHKAINDVMGEKVAFSPDDIRRAIPGGDGEMLARAWRQEVKRARNAAKAKVEKMYFSYRQTKADDIIRHATFFHYWMTRATAMHAEMALRNPWLAATYYRMWEGIKNNAEREGYPDTLNSYIRFMGESMFGAHAYVDALSFIVPFTMFREVSSEYAQPWEKIGVFLNPMAEGVLGAIGVSENIPNLIGTGSLERRVAAVLDWMEADGIGDGQPVEVWTRRVGEAIVEGANRALRFGHVPGVKEFAPFDPNMYYRDQMIHLIEFRAEQEYGPRAGWTPEQQAEVDAAKELVGLDARKNPLSAWAHDQWAEQSLWGQAFAWLVPARIRTAVRDENKVLADQGMDAIVDGDPNTEPTPEQQEALDIGAQAGSGDPVLVSQDQRYKALGTPNQQAVNDISRALTYGTEEDIRDIVREYGMSLPAEVREIERILALAPEEREAFAAEVLDWMNQGGELQSFRDERSAFREANPEYQQYNAWSSQMYDYPGGALAAAEDMRRISPNFDAFLRGEEEHGALTEGDVTGVEAYLAQQGEQWDVYTPAKDATDISAVPASNFVFGSGGGSGGSGSGEKKPKMTDAEKQAERITEDIAEYEAFLAIADQYVASISNGIPYEQLERGSRVFVDNQLEAAGMKPPSVSEDARLYMLWRSAQPTGADTSVEAFVAYMEGIKRSNAESIGVDPKAIEAVGDAGDKGEE